jgi:hypothetical protein
VSTDDPIAETRYPFGPTVKTEVANLKIYGVPLSRAYRALWMANELGLEYENVPIHFADGSAKTSEYLAVNPSREPAITTPIARCPRLPVVVFEAGIAVRNTLPIGWGQGKRDDQRSLRSCDGRGLVVAYSLHREH